MQRGKVKEIEFERYVNSKDNQTCVGEPSPDLAFERYVNSKDNQTLFFCGRFRREFERYVNSKDNQTSRSSRLQPPRLRDM